MANWRTIHGVRIDLDKNTSRKIASLERTSNNDSANDKTLDNAYKKAKDLQRELQGKLHTAHPLEDTDEIKLQIQQLDKIIKKLKDKWRG